MKTRELYKSEVALLFYLALMVFIIRLPTLIEPFDNDSEANAYHARQIVRGEPLYGTHHPAHHLPEVYYVYSLGFILFGDSVGAIKFLLVLWHIATAWLIYAFGKLLSNGDRQVGFLAGTFFAILTSHIWLKGTTGELELFANLPRTATILFVLVLLKQDARNWKFIFVGALSAAAFWYKAVFIAPLMVSVLAVCLNAWFKRERQSLWQAFWQLTWIGIGFATTSLGVVAYFAAVGVLPGLIQVFTLGSKYVSQLDGLASLVSIFLSPLTVLAINNFMLLIVSIISGTYLLRRIFRQKAEQPFVLAKIALLLWYGFAYIEAGISPSSWVHYSLIIVPPLSLLAAWGLVLLHDRWRTQKPVTTCLLSPATWLVSLACLVSLAVNFNFQTGFYRYLAGNLTRDEYFQIASLNARSELFMRPLIKYLQANTTPDDRIFIWSDYNFYYTANRLSPIDTIWPLYADATGSPQRIFGPQTKYIILGESVQIERPAWLLEGLEKDYFLEITISGLDLYRRNGR